MHKKAPPGVRQVTPGTWFNRPTIRSRRSRNEARIISASSCGPSMACTAAHWLMCEAQDSVLVIQRTKCGASTGFDAKPMRQPVIAQVLEAPSEITVLSYMPGNEAIEENFSA